MIFTSGSGEQSGRETCPQVLLNAFQTSQPCEYITYTGMHSFATSTSRKVACSCVNHLMQHKIWTNDSLGKIQIILLITRAFIWNKTASDLKWGRAALHVKFHVDFSFTHLGFQYGDTDMKHELEGSYFTSSKREIWNQVYSSHSQRTWAFHYHHYSFEFSHPPAY